MPEQSKASGFMMKISFELGEPISQHCSRGVNAVEFHSTSKIFAEDFL